MLLIHRFKCSCLAKEKKPCGFGLNTRTVSGHPMHETNRRSDTQTQTPSPELHRCSHVWLIFQFHCSNIAYTRCNWLVTQTGLNSTSMHTRELEREWYLQSQRSIELTAMLFFLFCAPQNWLGRYLLRYYWWQHCNYSKNNTVWFRRN